MLMENSIKMKAIIQKLYTKLEVQIMGQILCVKSTFLKLPGRSNGVITLHYSNFDEMMEQHHQHYWLQENFHHNDVNHHYHKFMVARRLQWLGHLACIP